MGRTTPNRLRRLVSAALLMVAAALLPGCTAPDRPRGGGGARPPVVLISIDTLRADHLPAYGYDGVETPHLDRFAADSILFENAVSHCPLTFPSHGSLFSGRLPYEIGIRDNLGYRLAAATPTLTDLLRGAGYRTGAAVSAYVLRAETGLGESFDFYEDAIERRADRTLDRLERRGEDTLAAAAPWLDERGEEPFFFFLHLFEPHDPYEPPEPFRSRFAHPYDGEIAAVDALLGDFFERLRQRGLYDRALIVVLSDHGEGLGDHGEPRHGLLLYRETLHVPLLVKLPGGERAGERVAAPAALVDVLPTVAEVAGLDPPPGLPGTSLLHLGEGPPQERRIYSETYYGRIHYGWSELHSLMDAGFHYIDSPNPELYDLAADPQERHNVLAEERRVFRSMQQELASLPLGFEEPAPVEAEEAAKLAALGYLAAPAAAGRGERPDPKENLDVLVDIQQAVDLQAAGRLEETVAVLKDLQRRRPEIQDVYLLLAPVLRGLGHHDEALAVGREGRRRLPTLAPLFDLEMARSHLALGELPAAEAAARSGTEANPVQGHELLARVALARGDLEAARRATEAALAADRPSRVSALLLAAEIDMLEERPEAALARLDAARSQVEKGQAPPQPSLESDRGDCLARLGRHEEAEAAFRREIEVFPGNRLAFSRLAFLLGVQRRFGEIEPLLEDMVRHAPERRSYELAAETLERLGNTEAAARWRARGARLPPPAAR